MDIVLLCYAANNKNNNNNNNNNNYADIYSAVIMAAKCIGHHGHWPSDQANPLEPQARLYRQPVNRIHHRHLLSLLSLKADLLIFNKSS